MKKPIALAVLFVLSFNIFAQKEKKSNASLKEIKIPMKAEKWDFKAQKVTFEEYKSVAAMRILPGAGVVALKDFSFTDGTIEFDMDPVDSRFSSIYFRRENEKESECFYLRVGKAGNLAAMDAVQYAPIVKGVNLWDLLDYDQGPAVIKTKDWNHIKLVISGKQMNAYVNEMARPALQIQQLEGNTTQGTLAFEGTGYIANLIVKPGKTESLSAVEGFDPTYNDSRYLKNWSVSQPVAFPNGREVSDPDFPTEQTKWQTIEAERRGLVNLTRVFGSSEERRLVWLKIKLRVESDQKHRIDFGFSDEVWVFMNGKMVYIDKNLYGQPVMKQPEGRCSVENTSFTLPFKSGENELLIAISNNFYGWGIIARLDAMEGITIQK